jgi:hypothetical protein
MGLSAFGGFPAGPGRRPGRGVQAIARTAVVPEAATRTATLGWCSRMTASAA